MHDQILLARQPIFDGQSKIHAYELLFRQYGDHGLKLSGDAATAELLDTVFTQLDFEQVAGHQPIFVNFTKALLDQPPPFDPRQLVIEVLEDIPVTDKLLQQLARLRESHYAIALDDFELTPETARLLPYADIVKIDVLALSTAELENHVRQVKQYDVVLLAEKVETQAMYQHCKQLGFHLFQGYYLCQPQIVKGKKIPASKLVVLELLSRLQDPEIDIDEIETLIMRDPVLSFKTLKLVNSPVYLPSKKLDSLPRAITYLGLDTIRALASLVALSNLSDKPSALRDLSVIRAKMCELLGERIAASESQVFFSVGLLSTLDAFFDQSMDSLIGHMSLRDDVVAALLHHENVLGEVLDTVINLQKAQFEKIDFCGLGKYGINPHNLGQTQEQSISWYQTGFSI